MAGKGRQVTARLKPCPDVCGTADLKFGLYKTLAIEQGRKKHPRLGRRPLQKLNSGGVN